MSCIGCKVSCCSNKVVALNLADVHRILKVYPNMIDFVIFRGDLPEGRMVKGDKMSGVLTLKQNNGSCVFLKDGRCSIYSQRPLACRLYPFNPLFREYGKGKYSYDTLIDKGCPHNNDFEFDRKLALQWRHERKMYDALVFKWNKRKNKNLIDFLRLVLNGAHNSN